MSTNHLLVFTRYPEAGQTKTRLIPCLGAEGAAELQRRMTEQLVVNLRTLPAESLWITIHHEGGDRGAMVRWLGTFDYSRQRGASLGDRLQAAFVQAFAAEAERVVVIGTDCPALSPAIILSAFEHLAERDLVLGPATDGGYYLLGLRQLHAPLFSEMPWGSDRLFAQTVAKATALNLSIKLLEPLSDVDRPQDLHHFHYYSNPERG